MANSYMTSAELVKFNDVDMDLVISDILNYAPLLGNNGLAAQVTTSIDYKYTKDVAAPSVGFRSINAGVENQTGTLEQVSVDLKYLDASTAIDVAAAQVVDRGVDFAVAQNAMRALKAAMFQVEKQIMYGTSNSAVGFNGFADSSLYDASGDAQVVVATSSGNVSSNGSDVWMVHSGPDGVEVIWGENGVLTVGETQLISRYEPVGGGYFQAYHTPIEGWVGVKTGVDQAIARISNLTPSNGLTDDLLAQAYEKFPMYLRPTHIIMSRRSLSQLQQNRTSYHPLGQPALRPVEWEGIPIIVSEGIGDNRAGI